MISRLIELFGCLCQSFFDDYHMDPPRPLDKYIASCYWSVMTASTVGYSGLPGTTAECMFLCVMMLGAAFIFGFIIGTVAGITATRYAPLSR